MIIVISTAEGNLIYLNVPENEEILNVRVLVHVETGIPLEEIQLSFKDRILEDTALLNNLGVKENDVLVCIRKKPVVGIDLSSLASNIAAGIKRPATNAATPLPRIRPRSEYTDPNVFRSYVMNDPNILTNLLHNDKDLAEAVLSDDNVLLESILEERQRQKEELERKRMMEIEQLNSDPLNLENQKLIEGKIQEENISENMENAMEHHPESFGRVVMLYINAEVNSVPIKAFVDSGAQQTIMSEDCAKRCGIMRLVDRRWAGIAQGVGTAKIIGRVHLAPIKIGNSFFPCSFTILEGQNLEFLLGLDMLRRHQCTIDLQKDVLRIQNETVPFLSEKDIPEREKHPELTEEQTTELEQNLKTNIPTTHPPPKTTTTNQPTTQPRPASNQPRPASNQPNNDMESSITQLMNLGYTRQQVIEALTVCNGNVELAGAYLFQM